MIRFKGTLLLIVTACLFSCDHNPVVTDGGSATDVGYVKGTIIKPDSSPAANTQVLLVSSTFNPITAKPDASILADTTDALGNYIFIRVKAGAYNIEAVHLTERSRLLILNQTVSKNDITIVPPFALKVPGSAVVSIPDSIRSSQGYVYIPGTTYSAPADSNIVVLDSIPSAVIPSIAYGSHSVPAPGLVVAHNVPIFPGESALAANFKCVLVVKDTILTLSEASIHSRLQSLGIAVTVKSDNSLTSNDSAGITFFTFCSTINPDTVKNVLRISAKPVLDCENGEYSAMKMTGPKDSVDFGKLIATSIDIVNPSHPLAAGLSGTIDVIPTNVDMPWGKPASTATVVATVANQPFMATVFCYETGSLLIDNTPAPARRVGLFLELEVTANLSADGWKIFTAAVNWCCAGN